MVRRDLERFDRGEPPESPDGRNAVADKRWESLDPARLSYEVIFAGDGLPMNARAFLDGGFLEKH